jgi:integrase
MDIMRWLPGLWKLRCELSRFRREHPRPKPERRPKMSVFKSSRSPFWQYDFHFRGRRYQGSTKLRNKTAALRCEANFIERLAKQRAGIIEVEPPPFFVLFAAQYLEVVKHALRPNTLRGYQTSLGNLEAFHKKRLDEISATAIEEFKTQRLADGRSPATVNRDLAFLRLVLGHAVRQDLLATTPFLQRKIKLLREHGKERIITFAEERRYLAVASDVLHDVAVIIIETAMRPGEVFALRAEDVQLRSNHLHIPTGKTDSAERDVPITERARRVLEARMEAAEGPCLFPLRVGSGLDWSKPMTSVKEQHRQAIKAAGLRWFRLYDLRHTAATRTAEGGASPLELQKLLGHRSLQTTARYVHLSKRHLAGVAARIERYRAEQEIAEAGDATVQ